MVFFNFLNFFAIFFEFCITDESGGFLPDREQKILKKYKKYLKIWKTPSWLLFKQKQDGKGRKREKKKIILMGSYPTGNRKFQKNSKKIQKFRKHHHRFFSSQNRQGKAEKERKKKKIVLMDSYGFLLDREQKIPKKQ